VNGAGLDRDVGGDGAGFPACLFGGEDIGEPAPTGIMWKKPISFVDGAGFPACLFGGTDIGEPAPTGIMWKKPISFVNGAGFPACLFAGTDIGEPAPTVKFFGENETALRGLGGNILNYFT
jgi:hypothetical protein